MANSASQQDLRGESSFSVLSPVKTVCESESVDAEKGGEERVAEMQGKKHTGTGVDTAQTPNKIESRVACCSSLFSPPVEVCMEAVPIVLPPVEGVDFVLPCLGAMDISVSWLKICENSEDSEE